LGSGNKGSKSAAIGSSGRGKIGKGFGGVVGEGHLLLVDHVGWMIALIL
jgi:hypothetical protein